LFGGTGNDTISTSDGNGDSVVGGSGNDTLAAMDSSDVTLFGGTGNDTLLASNDTAAVLDAGTGDDTLLATGGNHVKLLGGGSDTLISQNVANVSLFAGTGMTDIEVADTFNLPIRDPGLQPSNAVNIVGGSGVNHIAVDYTFVANTPGAPAVFDTPLTTNISAGAGITDIGVTYAFSDAGTQNGIIAVLAPISTSIQGGARTKKIQVDFASDVPTGRNAMPIVKIDAALNFNIQGGGTGALIGLLFGAPNSAAPGATGNVVIASDGTLNALLVGGAGHDTMKAVFWFNSATVGAIDARMYGSATGGCDLTMDIYGLGDASMLSAVIFGNSSDKFHHTDNVRVVE
jgi:hypothetical protein